MAEKMGVDCKAYINTGTYGTPTWAEMTNVQEVNVDGSRAETAFKARGKGSVQYKLGLADWDVSITFLYDGDAADANLVLMRDAFTGKTNVDLWLLDGASATSANQGLRSEFVVGGMSAPQPLEDALTVTFKARPAVSTNDPAWNLVA